MPPAKNFGLAHCVPVRRMWLLFRMRSMFGTLLGRDCWLVIMSKWRFYSAYCALWRDMLRTTATTDPDLVGPCLHSSIDCATSRCSTFASSLATSDFVQPPNQHQTSQTFRFLP